MRQFEEAERWRGALISVAMLLSMAASFTARSDEGSFSCSVTPMPAGGMLRNESLETGIVPNGTIAFGPGRAGFVLSDGSLKIKYGWVLRREGAFSITGRRLDQSAPALRASIAERTPGTLFQPASLIFPTTGCWEITGHLDHDHLTFIVRVILHSDSAGSAPASPGI